MIKRLPRVALTVGALLLASSQHGFTVPNTFHLMQIEQAIQLRMREPGQNLVVLSRVRAWNSAGANPVLIVDMTANVPNGNTGSRVLIASPQFAAAFPGATPDFLMTTLMPASFFTAGKLTFEDDAGSILWGLAWGGAGYTGTNTGVEPLNDPDLNFNPPFAGPLPSTTNQALRFPGPATAASTNNAADYAVTPGNAVFTNNAGASVTVPVELTGFSVQ